MGNALGAAAIGAILARGAALGAEAGGAGGGPGIAGGALIGAAGAGVSELVVQGLMRRGGTGGSSNVAPDPGGTISGFREQGVNMTQRQIAA